MKRQYTHLTHKDFGPLFDEHSESLILGSFPSVKSREQRFYYGHPQNRFWKIIAAIYGEPVPENDDIEAKKAMILAHHLALWDVIDECDITGSSDSSIRNAKVTDLRLILDHSSVTRIFVNGATAFRLYEKYSAGMTDISAVQLPSSSPANAAWSLDRLTSEWKTLILHS